MANHVYFNISVEGLDEEQWAALFKTEERTNKDYEGKDYTFTDLVEIEHQPFMENVDKEFDDDNFLINAYNWYCDNVGAKWCHIEEWENHGYISGYSAWSTPYEMVNNLMEYASNKYQIELSAKMTYEDEFRNFIGVDYFESYKDEEDKEYYCSHTEEYVDGNDLNRVVEEHFDCDLEDEEFNWGDEIKNQYGEMQVPSEFADDVVYEFFETGEWTR
jgi:hypothetical protein